MQKGTKASEISDKLWENVFLVHEKVLHGVGAKTRRKE
jgi:hypothetical protein